MIRERLLPLATVVTPNLLEAELLTGRHIDGPEQMLAAARMISAMGPQWVLVKGGHLAGQSGGPAVRRRWRYCGSRLIGSTASIRTGPAAPWRRQSRPGSRSATMCRPVRAAKDYVTGAIAAGFALGAGIGPVDHGWQLGRPRPPARDGWRQRPRS